MTMLAVLVQIERVGVIKFPAPQAGNFFIKISFLPDHAAKSILACERLHL